LPLRQPIYLRAFNTLIAVLNADFPCEKHGSAIADGPSAGAHALMTYVNKSSVLYLIDK